MSNYIKTTNFATKDSLPSGNPAKIVKGTEINTEFDNIAVASGTKADKASPVFTGTVTLPATNADSLSIGGDGVTVTGIKDEDDMASNSATKLASQQSIKAYVDSQVTAQDLDVTDGTTSISIDLDSEALSLLGGTGVTSTASGNGVTMAIDSTVATLTGTQTLTNKTLTTPVISGNLTTDGNIDGRDVATDGTKLDTVETNADVTDTVNVTAAGALMDSEVTNLAEVKAFDSTDYATAAQGTTADAALPKAGGAMTGAITTNSTFDGRDVATDGTKLDGIEALADVTDATNVTAAGALMDSELTSIASVKALNQGVATTDSPTFAAATVTGEITANGGIALGDSDKATFGADSDLQIYSDGTNAIIKEDTGGSLYIGGADVHLMNPAFTEYYISAEANGAVTLRHDNGLKLATTATGIDVTGTATMDGLTVERENLSDLKTWSNSDVGSIDFYQAASYPSANNYGRVLDINSGSGNSNGGSTIRLLTAEGNFEGRQRLSIASNGDISFYEDTGTTPKLFWDASAESLGIGTSSPSAVLETFGGTSFIGAKFKGYTTGKTALVGTDNNSAWFGLDDGTYGLTNSIQLFGTNNSIEFNTNGSEAMRIDSSGNVGIGTASPVTTLTASNTTQNDALGIAQVVNTTADDVSSSTMTVKNHSGTGQFMEWRTFGMRIGSRIITNNGVGDVTFTHGNDVEKMRLTATGLGIGTSSPNAALHVAGKSTVRNTIVSNVTLDGGSTVSNPYDGFGFGINFTGKDYSNAVRDYAYIYSVMEASGSPAAGGDAGFTAGLSFYTNGGGASGATPAERMRIDSSGNVGIGNSSPSTFNQRVSAPHLVVGAGSNAAGLTLYSGTNSQSSINFAVGTTTTQQYDGGITYHPSSYMSFHTNNGTERMRIDASGNLLVGTTDTDPSNNNAGNTTDNGIALRADGSLAIARAFAPVAYLNRTGTDGLITHFHRDGSSVGSIGVTSSATSYNTSSDYRLKENIADADDAGSKIDAIQVRKYDWKADGSHQDYGMVAQELQAVAPEAVSVPEDAEEMMGVDYSKLVPMLIKEIQSLRNRVAQLEE